MRRTAAGAARDLKHVPAAPGFCGARRRDQPLQPQPEDFGASVVAAVQTQGEQLHAAQVQAAEAVAQALVALFMLAPR